LRPCAKSGARGALASPRSTPAVFHPARNIFDLTGRVNLAATFVRVAPVDQPVAVRETYDPAEGYYAVRDLDTLTGVPSTPTSCSIRIVDARQ
jgi:carbamoyl-phosphate synthase large subunit